MAKMWEDWAKAHDTTTAAMTQAQKIEAEYNGILEETRFQVGDAIAYTKTFGGQLQQLKFNFNQMTVAIGKVVTPLAQLFIPVINSAISAVTNFFTKIQGLLKVFGLEMPDVVSKSSSGMVNLGSDAVDAASDIASTGSAAKKAAKEVNKAFAGIDEINVLNTKKDTSKDDNSGSSVGGSITTSTDEATKTVTKTSSAFSALIDRVKELNSLFKAGFNSTFNIDFSSINKHFNEIKQNLKGIFTSSEVLDAVDNWANVVSNNFGKITGSIGTIGGNIAELFLGSISTYLSQNSSRVTDYIANMFNLNSRMSVLKGNLFSALGSISEAFKSDVAKQIGANIIAMFTNPFMSLSTVFTQFNTDMYNLLVAPISNNVDKIKQAIDNTLSAIEPITSTLTDMFTSFGDNVKEIYDNYLHPFFEDVAWGISDTFGKFLDVYNQYIVPFFEKVGDIVKESWEKHLKPLWNNLSEFIGEIILLIQTIWQKWLKPLIDWIVQNIIPKLMPVFEIIANVISTIYNSVADKINGIITVAKGVIQFLTGVFSGDWSKAWTGIKNIFKGIIDSIASAFKLPINLLIDGINTFIRGINKIKIPDWVPAVGGKGFNIKEIQKLAQGGWVAPNSPQLAIVGDNKREGEVIAPESKIYNQALKAIKDSGGTGKQELTLKIMVMYEDGKKIIKKINQEQIDAGEILLLT